MNTKKIKPVVFMLSIMWGIFLFEMIIPGDLSFLGIRPRSLTGLIGLVTSPFLHGGFFHILSNTIPFFILGSLLFVFYKDLATKVTLMIILLGGFILWMIGRSDSIHIGASSVISGYVGFLIISCQFFVGI